MSRIHLYTCLFSVIRNLAWYAAVSSKFAMRHGGAGPVLEAFLNVFRPLFIFLELYWY